MPPVLRMDRGRYARGPQLTAEQASRRDHDSCYERGPTREQDQGFAHCGSPRPGANLNVLIAPAKFGHALHAARKMAECGAGATHTSMHGRTDA